MGKTRRKTEKNNEFTIMIQREAAFLRCFGLEGLLREGHRRHISKMLTCHKDRDVWTKEFDVDNRVGSGLHRGETIFVLVMERKKLC